MIAGLNQKKVDLKEAHKEKMRDRKIGLYNEAVRTIKGMFCEMDKRHPRNDPAKLSNSLLRKLGSSGTPTYKNELAIKALSISLANQ